MPRYFCNAHVAVWPASTALLIPALACPGPSLGICNEHAVLLFAAVQKLDVWTCGIMLCILLSGRSPFQRDEDALLDYKGQLRAMLQVRL